MFILYLRQKKGELFVAAACFFVMLISCMLYKVHPEVYLYPSIICFFILLVSFFVGYKKTVDKHENLSEIRDLTLAGLKEIQETSNIVENDFRSLLERLCREHSDYVSKQEKRYLDMTEYYTLWTHQIKTPIASMRLNLQNEDTNLSRQLQLDLLRIEQYVEMALVYVRLDSGVSDYVIKPYRISPIVKAAVKKFSGEFILRKLRLNIETFDMEVVTDEKWLSFVLEQIISNALKYTASGEISIFMSQAGILCIRDTGIGIAPEDVNRVFEKGFTGNIGRKNKNASGIGLYLCRKICKNLGHDIYLESELSKGTSVYIDLSRIKLEIY